MSVRDTPIHTPLLQLGDVEAKRDGGTSKTELGRRENRLWAGVVCYEACRSELVLCLTREELEGSNSEECRLQSRETYVSRGNQHLNKGEHPKPN